jgi:hypothetical protein
MPSRLAALLAVVLVSCGCADSDRRIAPETQGRNNADNTRNDEMKIRNVLVGIVFSVFAASSLASSGLAGQPAPDFALKSS